MRYALLEPLQCMQQSLLIGDHREWMGWDFTPHCALPKEVASSEVNSQASLQWELFTLFTTGLPGIWARSHSYSPNVLETC